MSSLKEILSREFYSDISKINDLGEIPEGSEPLLINEISKNLNNNILIIARDLKRYQQLKDGLEFFLNKDVLFYPQWDCVPYDRISPNKLITSKRLETLSRLSNEKTTGKIILTTIQASCQRTLSLDEVKNKFISLKPGEVIDINNLINFFISNGYEKTPTVREYGEFSVRGGIIDFYSPLNEPIRLDLFGNTIDSIKTFDLISQRSFELLKEIFVYPASEIILNDKTIENFRINFNKKFGSQKEKVKIYDSISEGISYPGMEHWLPFFYNQTGLIFDYINKPIIILDHLYDSSLEDFLDTVNDHFQSRKDYDDNKLSKVENKYFSIEPLNLYQNKEEYNKNLHSRNCIRISPFKKPDAINLNGKASTKYSNIKSNRNDSSSYENLKSDILDFTKKNKKIIIACSSLGSSERVAKILINNDISSNFKNLESFKNINQKDIYLAVLNLNSGFQFDDYIFISEQDIFGEKFYRPRIIKKAENFIREISSVMPGDAVVHVDHGIGRFENLSTLEINNAKHECLLIKYANDDKLYLPVENIEVLSRYGSDISNDMLDKLGGISWTKRKENLKKKIKFLAEELISVAAKRQLSKAEMFNVPEDFYEEFCSRFSFEETNDQLNAINDVLNDLEKGLPMDRLICGDVGFGKTEIALRASFLAAMSGKQVSILAPTTLLARQHYETFKDRFKGFPINVFELSRLTPRKDSVIKGINSGSCDIVIGTHSLLGEKINFSDLGLLIIDEEQHFGVKHKEKIKKLRDNVHVLTLTATPIPRTLQLAMTGVRDLSIIASPPIDRRAIETYVFPNDPLVVKEALLRERHRGGQSFYVVPRISDIENIEEYFREFIPEISYITVHGQMPSKQIEDRINDFYMGSYDVLISTTIIESGLDIPNANTLIIHRSDMFGLSQLYQIRGRVGRSKVKAYAYLTYKEHKKLGKKALKRLEVLQSLDSLGAGFNLASYDLEIRGSGNLLGEEQSGQIKEVGIELYQNMLEETIDELKNTTQKSKNNQWSPKISLPLSILIPEDYISDLTIRMEIYKRLSSIILEEEIDEIAAELIDRFGSLPQEVETLIDTIGLKNLCKKTNIEKIDCGNNGFLISFKNNTFSSPEELIKYINDKKNYISIRPDQRLFVKFKEQKENLIDYIKSIVNDFLKMIEN